MISAVWVFQVSRSLSQKICRCWCSSPTTLELDRFIGCTVTILPNLMPTHERMPVCWLLVRNTNSGRISNNLAKAYRIYRNRRLLATTLTELMAMAAPAIMGFSRKPLMGYKIPAASGMPVMVLSLIHISQGIVR